MVLAVIACSSREREPEVPPPPFPSIVSPAAEFSAMDGPYGAHPAETFTLVKTSTGTTTGTITEHYRGAARASIERSDTRFGRTVVHVHRREVRDGAGLFGTIDESTGEVTNHDFRELHRQNVERPPSSGEVGLLKDVILSGTGTEETDVYGEFLGVP